MMASPIPGMELFTIESSSQSEDAFQDQVPVNPAGFKPTSSRTDLSRSPPTEAKGRGPLSKKNLSQKGSGGDATDNTGSSRKKRSRATPSSTDDPENSNGRKSTTDGGGKDGKESLWPNAEGDGPVQGSLLEEVLAEKRMALLRSPEVARFLKMRQGMVQAVQQQAMLEAQQHELCVGEMEEDAVS